MTIGGYAIIMTDFAQEIINGQVSSLVFALITVFILACNYLPVGERRSHRVDTPGEHQL
ncbi:MAG: hypothetical protein MZV63_22280 [Marinilabiliales bacterium]|nr:hypothetical protein [Marinilabiliales bacterium]